MNFKFKQPPFYFYIILWIVALALGLQLDKKIQNLSDLFGLVKTDTVSGNSCTR
ncbi:hypothetical protein N9M33_02340 [Candidatus Pelagibacter bacterium]|nr:hypothetical protein [Candidatus Pelagibacter bacterium]MDB4217296.1 hypothetical protein [Candidatus Pelagibacter sp.]